MSVSTTEMGRVAVAEARATLESAAHLLGELESCFGQVAGEPVFKITPLHAIELHRYLQAHNEKLKEWCGKIDDLLTAARPPSEPLIQLLVSRRFEFESAIRFVEEAFIKPRRPHGEPLVLEVADWLCVEGFQRFVTRLAERPESFPLGPLVALDSRRSPAMWDDDTELSIPSLFDLTARIHRTAESSISGLAVFPVITLPADLSHLPEYYALLSHEVGHAVDAAFGFTTKIIASLEKKVGLKLLNYWKAWMREIVADASGVALSGEAFALAWWRFVRPMPPQTDLTYSDPYPPVSLRLSFLRQMLASRGELTPSIPNELPEESPLEHEAYAQLKADFETVILPLLQEFIFSAVPLEARGESFTRESAGLAVAVEQGRISWRQQAFRVLPSILTQAIVRQPVFKTWKHLQEWLQEFRVDNQSPGWRTQENSDWKFTKEFLPTLRPTITGPDGVTKIPPRVLLLTHRKIALLGATQKWLLKALRETAPHREQPWEAIDLYFASDTLLESVEYYSAKGRRRSIKSVRNERDKALADLKAFFQRNPKCCKQVRFYFFNGPPVFGSYWDWDQPGGRIHTSAQLAGIDLSKCPAIDHIWLQDEPTFTYRQYCDYLDATNKRAKVAWVQTENLELR